MADEDQTPIVEQSGYGTPLEQFEIDEANRPSTSTSFWFTLIVGLIFTLVMAILAYLCKPTPLKLFYTIIFERGPIQFFELLFAGMVVGVIIEKTRLLNKQHAYLLDDPVDLSLDLGDDAVVTHLRGEIRENDDFSGSIFLTRVDRVLAQWLGARDVGLVATWTSAESDRDHESAGLSNVLSSVLLASIPMLGFIGTVLGLSTAVGGFSDFLGGEVEMNQIKDALREVTGSLGTAFDTTLLALVLSVILTFPLSLVVRRESDMLTEFESYVDDKLISKLPPPEPASIRIENLEDSIDAAFRRYIPDPDRYDEVFSRAIDRAGTTVEEKFANLISSYEGAIADMTQRLAGTLTATSDSVEVSMRNVVSDVQKQDELMVSARKSVAQEEAVHLKAMLEDYSQSVSALQASTSEGMAKTVGAAEQLAGKLDVVQSVAGQIEKLLHLEESVERSLAGLESSEDFRTTLSSLRTHLAETDAFVKEMRKPRVITLREDV